MKHSEVDTSLKNEPKPKTKRKTTTKEENEKEVTTISVYDMRKGSADWLAMAWAFHILPQENNGTKESTFILRQ